MSTHFTPRDLPDEFGVGSRVMYSVNPSGKMIVFVHGFNGHATRTWSDFPGVMVGRPRCADADLFFYGYDALRTSASVSAAMLRENLQSIWGRPMELANRLLDREAARRDFTYASITLVAHSLGAIVSRLALVDAMRSTPRDEWVAHARLVLFAPAHSGASVIPLAVQSLTGLPAVGAYLNAVVPWVKFRYRVLQDLEPECDLLKDLADRTKRLVTNAPQSPLRAACVVWAEHDSIVRPIPFADDPPARIARGKGHNDVCKPSGRYLLPIEVLEEVQ